MIDTLISNKTRIKLLLKFFLNSNTTSYLRGLESEFGESSNAIRLELNRLEGAGMLKAHSDGNKKMFQANREHPLFSELQSIIRKHIGLDKIIENVVERLGNVHRVYLAGSFAQGIDSPVIDLILVGEVQKDYLVQLIDKAERIIPRKIRYLIYDNDQEKSIDWESFMGEPLLIWESLNNTTARVSENS
ncbi:MAG: ArsR family transcriptional regulator [Saprospiraceae bacterium]|nr:ArsR family transcriptional regulator [Saprospiraceae bacterium]